MFSVFKQHYMYFHTFFHPHVFSKNTNNVTKQPLVQNNWLVSWFLQGLDFAYPLVYLIVVGLLLSFCFFYAYLLELIVRKNCLVLQFNPNIRAFANPPVHLIALKLLLDGFNFLYCTFTLGFGFSAITVFEFISFLLNFLCRSVNPYITSFVLKFRIDYNYFLNQVCLKIGF